VESCAPLRVSPRGCDLRRHQATRGSLLRRVLEVHLEELMKAPFAIRSLTRFVPVSGGINADREMDRAWRPAQRMLIEQFCWKGPGTPESK
jgi:hypothetical protein